MKRGRPGYDFCVHLHNTAFGCSDEGKVYCRGLCKRCYEALRRQIKNPADPIRDYDHATAAGLCLPKYAGRKPGPRLTPRFKLPKRTRRPQKSAAKEA